jgi:hypothetical protein
VSTEREYYRALYRPRAGGGWEIVAYAAVTESHPGGHGPGGGLDGMQQAHEAHGLPRMREAEYATRDAIKDSLPLED